MLYDYAQTTLGWQSMPATKPNPVIRYDLCNPAAKIVLQPLASVPTIPQLPPFDPSANMHWTSSIQFPEEVFHELRKIFTAVADNAWLGELYGPSLKRWNFALNERITELFRTKNAFSFLKIKDAATNQYVFSLQNDPLANELVKSQIHTRVHKSWGSFSKALPWNEQSTAVTQE